MCFIQLNCKPLEFLMTNYNFLCILDYTNALNPFPSTHYLTACKFEVNIQNPVVQYMLNREIELRL